MYVDCLFTGVKVHSTMTSIRSDHHVVNTIKLNKVSLSNFDDKRFILENGCDTLAHGHYKIQEYSE